jgi:hypothetical protein
MSSAGGVRDRSHMAATHRGAGRSPQSPTAVRRDAPSTNDIGPTAASRPNVSNPTKATKATKATKTIYDHNRQNRNQGLGVLTRFRCNAFGFRGTQLAIDRINEALAEVRAVVRHD